MRISLIPLRVKPREPRANLVEAERRIAEAAAFMPDLVLLPECALTGYLFERADLRRFAETIPGPTTRRFSELARRHNSAICLGLIEATDDGVYDAAVLINRAGDIILKHRKIAEKPPFLVGNTVVAARLGATPVSVLLCGDLFDAATTARLDPSVAAILAPMARSFDGMSPDYKRWVRHERDAYLEVVKGIGRTAFLVNLLESVDQEGAFGGALVVGADGGVLAEAPHGTDKLLTYDLPASRGG